MILTFPFLQHPTKKIVYIPTLKVASRYFITHLLKHGFVERNQGEIDFEDNFVFSHIMHPIQRRNKGVAEFFSSLVDMPDEWLLQKIHEYPQFLIILVAPYFDEHSAPLHLMYEGFIDRICFIPIDVAHIDYYQITSDLLKQHDLEIVFPRQKIHQSEESKIRLFHMIEMHLESSCKYSDVFQATFSKDIALYQNIVDKFDPNKSA